MLDKKNPDLYDGWLTANERLTRFRKSINQIVGKVKEVESPSIQGPQSS